MKLRNKKTGETIDVVVNPTDFNTMRLCRVNIVKSLQAVNTWEYNSLAELNADWEDAPEEPKDINEIDVVLDAIDEYCNEHSYYSGDLEKIKILNIVEDKLKAWKRLEDSGVMFKGWGWDKGLGNYVVLGTKDADYVPDEIELNRRKDLDLLFGGEE